MSINQGPNNPTAASGAVWSSPTNIEGSSANATYSVTFGADQFTSELVGSGFGFSIPSGATINGISFTLNRRVSSTVLFIGTTNTVKLRKAGVDVGSAKGPGSVWTTTGTDETWGTSSDLWGTTWTPSDINNSDFGVGVVCEGDFSSGISGARALEVQNYRLTVTYTTRSRAVCSQIIGI